MQFVAIEQFPLDMISRIEANGGGHCQGETHVEPGLLSLGTDGLDFQGISRLHFVCDFACIL